jgi:hypothetical protein
MPITVTEPGVEGISNPVDQGSVPQARVPSHTATGNSSRRDFFIATLASVGIAAHLPPRYGFSVSSLPEILPLYLALFMGGLSFHKMTDF